MWMYFCHVVFRLNEFPNPQTFLFLFCKYFIAISLKFLYFKLLTLTNGSHYAQDYYCVIIRSSSDNDQSVFPVITCIFTLIKVTFVVCIVYYKIRHFVPFLQSKYFEYRNNTVMYDNYI